MEKSKKDVPVTIPSQEDPSMPGSSTALPTANIPSSSIVIPTVSPIGVRQTKVNQVPSVQVLHDNDVVCAFDRTFHYMDPFQPLSVSDKKASPMSCKSSVAAVPSSSSSPEQEEEAEKFFKDFVFPDIGPEIEDDAVFSDMLASLIG